MPLASAEELRLGDGAGADVDRALHGRAGVAEHEHEGVADLLDNPTFASDHAAADEIGEAVEDLGGRAVTHGFCQRGETRDR